MTSNDLPDAETSESEPAARSNGFSVVALMTILGGVLFIAGSFMPWINYSMPYGGEVGRNGLDGGGDGIFTLVIGLAIALIGTAQIASSARPIIQWASIILGVVGGLWSINDLAFVEDEAFRSSSGYAITGPGIYVMLVGAVVTLLAGGPLLARALARIRSWLRQVLPPLLRRARALPRRWIAAFVVALLVVVFFVAANARDCAFRGLFPPSPAPGSKNATRIVTELGNEIPALRLTATYTAETDPNELMGCPSAYTSKAMFSDGRFSQEAVMDPDAFERGGSVEVFADELDAEKRSNYLREVIKAKIGILDEYHFLYDNVLLRVSRRYMPPSESAMYEAAMDKVVK